MRREGCLTPTGLERRLTDHAHIKKTYQVVGSVQLAKDTDAVGLQPERDSSAAVTAELCMSLQTQELTCYTPLAEETQSRSIAADRPPSHDTGSRDELAAAAAHRTG